MRHKINTLMGMAVAVVLLVAGASSVVRCANDEQVVRDSMKRFTMKAPTSWKVIESAEGNSMSITGDDVAIVISPVYGGANLEDLHRRMALQFAYRSMEGPPKKNKVKWDKRGVGRLKTLESVYDIKGGPEDPHKVYRVHVLTLDGDKHKYSILVTIPWDGENKQGLEDRVMPFVNSFVELE